MRRSIVIATLLGSLLACGDDGGSKRAAESDDEGGAAPVAERRRAAPARAASAGDALPEGFVALRYGLAARCPGEDWSCSESGGFLAPPSASGDPEAKLLFTRPRGSLADRMVEAAGKNGEVIRRGSCAGGGRLIVTSPAQGPKKVSWLCARSIEASSRQRIICQGLVDRADLESYAAVFEETCASVIEAPR